MILNIIYRYNYLFFYFNFNIWVIIYKKLDILLYHQLV